MAENLVVSSQQVPWIRAVPRPPASTARREGVTEEGFLVLADISGFTAFVTATELGHGADVTAALLGAVVDHLAPHLEIQELEGDAVFALGPDRRLAGGPPLVDVLENAFRGFKERQRLLRDCPSCSCAVCRRGPELDLKFVVHHGRFVRQVVAGHSRVAGPDVVLVHRLVKNEIPGDAYLLLTQPALERAGLSPQTPGLEARTVTYPHFGDVLCFVTDLAQVWSDGRESERGRPPASGRQPASATIPSMALTTRASAAGSTVAPLSRAV